MVGWLLLADLGRLWERTIATRLEGGYAPLVACRCQQVPPVGDYSKEVIRRQSPTSGRRSVTNGHRRSLTSCCRRSVADGHRRLPTSLQKVGHRRSPKVGHRRPPLFTDGHRLLYRRVTDSHRWSPTSLQKVGSVADGYRRLLTSL